MILDVSRHLLMSVMKQLRMSMMKILTLLLPVIAVADDSVTKQTLFGCNDDRVILHCDPGSHISIVRANYGRFSLSICNSEASGTLRTSCDSSLSSSNILRTRLVCTGVFSEYFNSGHFLLNYSAFNNPCLRVCFILQDSSGFIGQ